MSRFYTTTLRFNLDKPDDRMALQCLQDAGKEEYKSLNRAVIAAVNDHVSRSVANSDRPVRRVSLRAGQAFARLRIL